MPRGEVDQFASTIPIAFFAEYAPDQQLQGHARNSSGAASLGAVVSH